MDLLFRLPLKTGVLALKSNATIAKTAVNPGSSSSQSLSSLLLPHFRPSDSSKAYTPVVLRLRTPINDYLGRCISSFSSCVLPLYGPHCRLVSLCLFSCLFFISLSPCLTMMIPIASTRAIPRASSIPPPSLIFPILGKSLTLILTVFRSIEIPRADPHDPQTKHHSRKSTPAARVSLDLDAPDSTSPSTPTQHNQLLKIKLKSKTHPHLLTPPLTPSSSLKSEGSGTENSLSEADTNGEESEHGPVPPSRFLRVCL